jgi:recombination protein RecA
MAKIKKENESFEDKMKALEEKYGKGSIVSANNFEKVSDSTCTGSPTLDIATGIGGVPKNGKITQILGDEQTGKTTLAMHIVANEQKKGNKCCYLDVEGTLDTDYCIAVGIDLTNLYIINPSKLKSENISGEQWLNICADMIDSNAFGVIVLDSVAALVPESEFTGVDTVGMGKIARMNSQGFRLINSKLLRSDCGLILLNQYRKNIGGYGNPNIPAGGEALKYYTAMKIELTRSIDRDTTTKEAFGINVKAKITKNKFSNPHKEAEYYIEFGRGIVAEYEIIELALEKEIIVKSGNTYSYNELKVGVGRAQLETFLADNPELLDEIKQRVFEREVA